MRVQTILTSCLCVCLAIAVCGAAPRSKKPKKNAKELKQKLHSVRAQIHQKRVEIRQVKRQEHAITDQIESVERRLVSTEDHLDRVKSRLKVLGKEEKVLNTRIAATEKRLDGRRKLLARRLRENYEQGSTGYVEVLLKSRSVNDYMSRSYYVERIVDSDISLMVGIKADRKQLDADRKRLQQQTEEQKQLADNLKVEYAQYKADVDTKRELLEQAHDTRENMQEALDDLEQSSHDIEEEIRASQRTPKGRERLLKAWSGSFIRPASGPITSGFGSRYHPILHRTRMHTGVDIGAGYGAPIHAAAGGEVVIAGYKRGYGNTVVIDHGGGVTTLYGHMSSISVSEGQTVGQGTQVGRVGSTGLATGPHLHFEVRHNGTPVNPL